MENPVDIYKLFNKTVRRRSKQSKSKSKSKSKSISTSNHKSSRRSYSTSSQPHVHTAAQAMQVYGKLGSDGKMHYTKDVLVQQNGKVVERDHQTWSEIEQQHPLHIHILPQLNGGDGSSTQQRKPKCNHCCPHCCF